MPTPRPSNESSARVPGRWPSPTPRPSASGTADGTLRKEPMTAIIRTEALTKSYGSHRGIVEVDLEVNEGEVFGFLGPNGAGETTTIRTGLDLRSEEHTAEL